MHDNNIVNDEIDIPKYIKKKNLIHQNQKANPSTNMSMLNVYLS